MITALLRRAVVAASLAFPLVDANAHSTLSEASLISTLPIAVSLAAPVVVLSAGAALTIVAVETTARGTAWVLERASDGARTSLVFAGRGSAELSRAAGTVVVVTALGTGWLLSSAGEAIAFVPNPAGAGLLHHERITR